MSLVVQLFDVTLDYVLNVCLKKCKEYGVKYVLLPPQQKYENIDNEWWSIYQPNFLYDILDEVYLKHVVSEFKKNGINILIDVIFSHTNKKGYVNNKDAYNYNPEKDWLPWLDTTNSNIIKNGKDMIKKYRDMGVRGFRIDSAIKVEHVFYDYVFKDSPSDEIHVYEELDLSVDGKNFMKNRLNVRPKNTFFYDIKELDNSISLLKTISKVEKEEDNVINSELFYKDTIIPDNGVSIISTHDLLTHRWYLEFDLFKSGLLISFMSCHPFIFITICSNETSSIYNCSLWSWDILKYFCPIIKLRQNNTYCPSILYNNYNNIVSQTSKSIFFLNLADSDTSNHQSVYFTKYKYKDVYNNKIFENKINLPENKLLVLEKIEQENVNENVNENVKENNLHIFWYQGWDNAPSFAKRSQLKWREVAQANNLQVISWDYEKVMNTIDKKNRIEFIISNVFNKIEEKIRIPEKYAAFSDIARLYILYKYGGIYVDTDSFPTKDSWLLFKWLKTGKLMFGREPNGYINNAIIISSIDCKHTLENLIMSLSQTILNEDINYKNILNIAGPQKITNIMDLKDEKYKKYVFIIPSSWLYTTWSSEKTGGIDENCTDEFVIAQHCYAGSWVDKDTKYIGYGDYYNYYKKDTKEIKEDRNNDKYDNIFTLLIFLLTVLTILCLIVYVKLIFRNKKT